MAGDNNGKNVNDTSGNNNEIGKNTISISNIDLNNMKTMMLIIATIIIIPLLIIIVTITNSW